MICKGTTHNNGAKLARYMVTGKEGERAELWELIGFAPGEIREAFRSVHVMAEVTRCEQPFFHVQVRNPDGEELTRDEWRQVADRIESKLGLTDQPRAIAFHLDERTGHEHMHVAWSRIDSETMTARPLPFFKQRLKEVAREIENTLNLTRVRNERESTVQVPTRNEFEQARRLGVDIQAVRETIRDCWDHSDCGLSFSAALADQGLTLAQGDRRDFVVLDSAGGLHALGKRILGVSASQTRERLTDIDRDSLPNVEQARALIAERENDRSHMRNVRMPDPYREELRWQDALSRAAIDKEKLERRFVESVLGRPAGRQQNPDPFVPPQPKVPPYVESRMAGLTPRAIEKDVIRAGGKTLRAAGRIGKSLDTVANAIESLIAPQLTPKQKREGERADRQRKAESETQIEISQYLANREHQVRQQEQERETIRQRQPDERER